MKPSEREVSQVWDLIINKDSGKKVDKLILNNAIRQGIIYIVSNRQTFVYNFSKSSIILSESFVETKLNSIQHDLGYTVDALKLNQHPICQFLMGHQKCVSFGIIMVIPKYIQSWTQFQLQLRRGYIPLQPCGPLCPLTELFSPHPLQFAFQFQRSGMASTRRQSYKYLTQSTLSLTQNAKALREKVYRNFFLLSTESTANSVRYTFS